MIVVRYRSSEDTEHTLRKLKKMKRFVGELIECMEDEHSREDDDEYDDDAEYREMEEMERGQYRGQYRGSGGRYSYRRGGGRM